MITHLATVEDGVPRRYPAEFRRKVLDLVAAGRPVAQVAYGLQISAQTICTWRRQQLIDSGQMPGMTSTDHAELVAARKRIAGLENELAIHRRAADLLGDVVSPKGGTRRSR
jgi:transposase